MKYQLPWINQVPKGRSLELDLLRGVAILLVMGVHLVVPPGQAGCLEPVAGFWMQIGWSGVDLFFVLSGFLISGLLFHETRKHGELKVGRFLLRRGFKIWPTYIAFLLFLIAAFLVKYRALGAAEALQPLYANFFHVQNYFGSPRVHTWSLAVEEHFYLVLPLVLALVLKLGKNPARAMRPLPILVLGLTIGIVCLRWMNASAQPFDYWTHQYPTHLRADSLLWGVFLGYIYHYHRGIIDGLQRFRPLLAVVGIAFISPFFFQPLEKSFFLQVYGFTLLYIGYGFILLALLNLELNRTGRFVRAAYTLTARGLAFIGFYSYSIYVWHLDFGGKPSHLVHDAGILDRFGPAWMWAGTTAVFILGSVLAGMILAKAIEIPCLKARDKWFPSRSGSAV